MSRPIRAIIHSQALQHNLQRVKELAPGSRLWAVCKANGYGHGLATVAKAFAAAGADGFALLEVSQALALREQGYQHPVILLEGVFAPEELPVCAEHGFTVVIHSQQQLQWLQTARLPRPLAVALKLNTGMNRLGFAPELAAAKAAELKACPNVASILVMTHFATADVNKPGISGQYDRFCQASDPLGLPVSVANSAAICIWPQTHRDWVRPGIMLYGSSPVVGQSAADLGLQTTMTLTSAVIGIQAIQPGDTVGYGATFTAQQPMLIGTVACGYADGYPRHAPTGTPVWVNGQCTRLVGRISMDMLAVDLTGLNAQVGSPVELWGRNLPIDEVATAAGTISYELMCAVAPRVPMLVD